MSDDITFCESGCDNKKCFRHPNNIREPRIPHSFAYLKDTKDCPLRREEMKIDNDDFGALAVCAIRYCQGRQTYMPSLVRGIVTQHIAEVTNRDLQVMLNDCESQAQWGEYGSDYDKKGWLEWKEFLINEQKRRKQNEGSN